MAMTSERSAWGLGWFRYPSSNPGNAIVVRILAQQRIRALANVGQCPPLWGAVDVYPRQWGAECRCQRRWNLR